jgi:hypothetical protein
MKIVDKFLSSSIQPREVVSVKLIFFIPPSLSPGQGPSVSNGTDGI